MSGFDEYQFCEMSLPTTDVDAQEAFWTTMFDAKTIFRGRMMGQRFTRMMVCGISLIFREDPDFVPPPGPGEEFLFRSHLGIRVHDMDAAIEDLEAKGAQFVLTPDIVRQLQRKVQDDGEHQGHKYLETDYIRPPLTLERIKAGDFKHDVAILAAPDNYWVELNHVREPDDTRWYVGS